MGIASTDCRLSYVSTILCLFTQFNKYQLFASYMIFLASLPGYMTMLFHLLFSFYFKINFDPGFSLNSINNFQLILIRPTGDSSNCLNRALVYQFIDCLRIIHFKLVISKVDHGISERDSREWIMRIEILFTRKYAIS